MTTYSEWGPEQGELEFIKRRSVSARNVLRNHLGCYICRDELFLLSKKDQKVLFRRQGEDDSYRGMPKVSWGCREHGEGS